MQIYLQIVFKSYAEYSQVLRSNYQSIVMVI